MKPGERKQEDFASRLARLDPGLLKGVMSSASAGDRRTLLALHREVRQPGYTYAEIGSEFGGSLQAHLEDPWCGQVFSIDLRVAEVDDRRGKRVWYEGNTTAAMREALERARPGATARLTTFDAATRDVPPARLEPRPTLVFIDAEHTDRAALEDFRWALAVVRPDGWVVFHDASLVSGAIRRARRELEVAGREYVGGWLPDDVYAIALGAGAGMRMARLPGPVRSLFCLRVVARARAWGRGWGAMPTRLNRWRRARFPRLAFWRVKATNRK